MHVNLLYDGLQIKLQITCYLRYVYIHFVPTGQSLLVINDDFTTQG